jgi:hypothetical protein
MAAKAMTECAGIFTSPKRVFLSTQFKNLFLFGLFILSSGIRFRPSVLRLSAACSTIELFPNEYPPSDSNGHCTGFEPDASNRWARRAEKSYS